MGMLTIDDIRAAHERIAGHVHCTPVMRCATLDLLADAELCFKCENFQKVGAFKFRGATNAVAQITAKHVITHSSGNHGQALALAAREYGKTAHVVVPKNALKSKVDAIRGYGAEVTFCEPNQQAREDTCAELQQKFNAELVHPYDDLRVMAGQGTLALELLEQEKDIDCIVIPVGGGGMLSGVSTAFKALRPQCLVVAAEPKNADDCARSLQEGKLVTNAAPPQTIADGLLTNLGVYTFPVIQQNVDSVVVVEEDEIKRALRLMLERMKVVIEPSAAVGLAAVLSPNFAPIKKRLAEKLQKRQPKIAIVLSGGNVDLDQLPSLLNA
eukprot:GEMP01048290.1.p1 GENE.GEMP01048290.1~~GEMP01048290.1.p1  ORF type:complete len:327 (+),score=83.63 GEMP01048290.1:182-1162(+)